MSITYPEFTNMKPDAEDIQLIVDSLRESDRNRITKDGIFSPGIIGQESDYLSQGTGNSIKIKPFIAYTKNGDRIESTSILDGLYPSGNVIKVTDKNLVDSDYNIPKWGDYNISTGNLTISTLSQTITLTQLGRGSILHGIKLRATQLFNFGNVSDPNDTNFNDKLEVYVCIGTQTEPEKFLPPTLISQDDESTNISVMNLMYSLDDDNTTEIQATIFSESTDLSTLTYGTLQIYLCIANLEGYDNEDLNQVSGGYKLDNSGSWLPSMTYHIVARYEEFKHNYRGLNYIDQNGKSVITDEEPTRVQESFSFYALRKSGNVFDSTTSSDVKLGEVITDEQGNIDIIKNSSNYVDYLRLPAYTIQNLQKAYLDRVTNCILSKSANILTYTLNNPDNMQITIRNVATLLIPNGLTINNTLNNIEYSIGSNLIITASGTSEGSYILLRNKSAYIIDKSSVKISNTEPNDETTLYWFNPNANKWYYRNTIESDFEEVEIGLIGEVVYNSSVGITSITEYPVMQLVTHKELENFKQEVNNAISSKADVTQLDNKLDKNLNNLDNTGGIAATYLNSKGIITVVDAWHNGTEFYRKHSDGWIEQGGQITIDQGFTTSQISFNTNALFTNTNYKILLSCSESRDTGVEMAWKTGSKTVAGLEVSIEQGKNEAHYIDWYACGY